MTAATLSCMLLRLPPFASSNSIFSDDGDVTNDSDKHVSRKGRDHRHVRSSDLPSEYRYVTPVVRVTAYAEPSAYRHDGSDSDRQHQSRVTNARYITSLGLRLACLT